MKSITSTVFVLVLLLTVRISAQEKEWWTVGSAGFSAGEVAYTSIAIDGSGTPYVVYQDEANSNKTTVMKYNGNSWEVVGSAGFSEGEVSDTKITIDGSGIPYVVYTDYGNSEKATVMKFNGSSWQAVGSAGFSGNGAYYPSIAIDGNDIPYVVFRDNGYSFKTTVMKYDGSWQIVGSAGFSAGAANYTTIAIDGSDIPYIAYMDAGNSSKATVMKYNGSSWQAVGSAGFSAGMVEYTSIAINSSGIPYVVFRDAENSYYATVMKYDGSWQIVGSAGFSYGPVEYTSIAIDGGGTPYVVYSDNGLSSKGYAKKYESGAWDQAGTIAFSSATAGNTSIAIAPNGVPVVVFRDGANSSKATVKKLAVSEDYSLPVELTSFTVQAAGNAAVLKWMTESEVNNYGFEIERKSIPVSSQSSAAGNPPTAINDWQKVGFVKGAITSSVPCEYSFNDPKVPAGRYAYHLKQIDLDGSFGYSPDVEIEIIPNQFSLSRIYPNPFNHSTNISFSITSGAFVSLKVFNALGREVSSLISEELSAGNYTHQWNATGRPSGIYFYRLQIGSDVQIRKILLLK